MQDMPAARRLREALRSLTTNMLYSSLLKSLLVSFESRNESRSSSGYGASVAITALLRMNFVTLTLFAYAVSGAQWFKIFQSIPLNIVGLFVSVAVHSQVFGRLQRERSTHSVASDRISATVPLWVWY